MKRLLLLTIMMIAMAIANAQIIHVPGDYPTIQEGIDAAQFFGDTVLVDEGTYFENISFSGKMITVASHFILSGDSSDLYNTIIDGSQPANPDMGSVVYFNNGEDTNSVISGFTIQGGTGTHAGAVDVIGGAGIFVEYCGAKITHNRIINNNIYTDLVGSGGGIGVGDIYNTSYVVIRHNRISNNTIESVDFAEGGGMSVYSNAIIEHNIITHNEIFSEAEQTIGGGIRCVGVLESRFINCSHNQISYNVCESSSEIILGGAGGMQAYYCFGNISNNTISYNEVWGPIGSVAGGLHFGYCGTSMILENNYISDNTSNYSGPNGFGGGVGLFSSNIQMINNVIARNYAETGAGIYIHLNPDGTTQIINNTIAFNEGDYLAIYLDDADAVVLNSILWNFGEEIYGDPDSIEVAYSDVFGGWPGEWNIDEDPDFTDDTCHLSCIDNPCIDMGIVDFTFSGTKYNAPLYDFDGEERPMDAGFDMGADESKICVGLREITMSDNINLTANPNPCSGALHLRYQKSDIRNLKCELFSMDGLLVKMLMNGIQQPGKYEMEIDLSDLTNGMYLIRLQAGNSVETAKIILQK